MRVSFFVGECHDFLLCPEEGGGGGVLSFMVYTGRLHPKALGEGGWQQIFVRGGNVPRSPLPVEKTFLDL